ncbi:MAG TPA: sulfotransferase domain-containing protein [Magnetospirillum sp.]|nr:sulfotransferase domain-containing protein [Magnetospirillum sp.]
MSGLVLLASYPKSGNTWMRAFVESLRQGGQPIQIATLRTGIPNIAWRGWFGELMGVEASDLEPGEIARARPDYHRRLCRFMPGWAAFKVHDCQHRVEPDGEWLFPADSVAAVVYVVRDPRDVAVSLSHHIGRPIDEAIRRMADHHWTASLDGEGPASQFPQFRSSWSGHVESWLDAQRYLRLHLIRYEDMIANPQAAFGAVAAFLGLDTSPAAVAAAVAATTFDSLRAQEEAHGFCERPSSMEFFFRSGKAGGWQDRLSPEQAERIVTRHGAVMRRLGYLP